MTTAPQRPHCRNALSWIKAPRERGARPAHSACWRPPAGIGRRTGRQVRMVGNTEAVTIASGVTDVEDGDRRRAAPRLANV